MIKVLIVDDHAVVRRGLRQILADERDIEVLETADPREVMPMLKTSPVDLLILDLDLPEKNGLDLLKDVKRMYRRLPVLILSVYPEEQFAVRVLKAGASGFISKDAAPEDLVNAIRKILRGKKHVSERVAEIWLGQIDESIGAQLHEKLSDREFQILCLLGKGKNVKSIAEDLSVSPPTVSTHRARILEKMGMKTTAELIHYAVKNGLAT
jgi:two-component system invasion response regulator UvrY